MNKRQIERSKEVIEKAMCKIKQKLGSIYTCKVVKSSIELDEKYILENYQYFLAENYPMIFIYSEEGNLIYNEYLKNNQFTSDYYDIFQPSKPETEFRVKLLESYLKYLDNLR